MENFSGAARFGSDLSIRTATITGRVFMGNQFVKTVSLAKAGKGLGIAGGIIGTGISAVGVVNGDVHPAKFAADGVMTAVGIWGGPMGAGVSVLYSGIDAYYPGGVVGYGHDYGDAIYNMQRQNPEYMSQQMFP